MIVNEYQCASKDANRKLTDNQDSAYLGTYHSTSTEVCYIYKTRNEMVQGVLRLSFPAYNSLIRQ